MSKRGEVAKVDESAVDQLKQMAQVLDIPLAQTEPEWTVSEVAEQTNISIDTLRYYERLGLIDPVTRTSGGRRMYSDLDIERIRFVRRLRATAMPVATVAEYVRLRAQGPATARERLDLLLEHRKLLAQQQAELAQNIAAVDTKISYYKAMTTGEALNAVAGETASPSPTASTDSGTGA